MTTHTPKSVYDSRPDAREIVANWAWYTSRGNHALAMQFRDDTVRILAASGVDRVKTYVDNALVELVRDSTGIPYDVALVPFTDYYRVRWPESSPSNDPIYDHLAASIKPSPCPCDDRETDSAGVEAARRKHS